MWARRKAGARKSGGESGWVMAGHFDAARRPASAFRRTALRAPGAGPHNAPQRKTDGAEGRAVSIQQRGEAMSRFLMAAALTAAFLACGGTGARAAEAASTVGGAAQAASAVGGAAASAAGRAAATALV